jgi:hypothetical protein
MYIYILIIYMEDPKMRGTPKSSILYEEFPFCKLAIYGILTAPHLRANALTLPC